MKLYTKLSILSGFIAILLATVAIAGITKEEITATTVADYLRDKEVSFLIVESKNFTKLTSFDWLDAKRGCQNIKNAGFDINTVRNFSTEALIETNATCK